MILRQPVNRHISRLALVGVFLFGLLVLPWTASTLQGQEGNAEKTQTVQSDEKGHQTRTDSDQQSEDTEKSVAEKSVAEEFAEAIAAIASLQKKVRKALENGEIKQEEAEQAIAKVNKELADTMRRVVSQSRAEAHKAAKETAQSLRKVDLSATATETLKAIRKAEIEKTVQEALRAAKVENTIREALSVLDEKAIEQKLKAAQQALEKSPIGEYVDTSKILEQALEAVRAADIEKRVQKALRDAKIDQTIEQALQRLDEKGVNSQLRELFESLEKGLPVRLERIDKVFNRIADELDPQRKQDPDEDAAAGEKEEANTREESP